jgi:hypothetical protein
LTGSDGMGVYGGEKGKKIHDGVLVVVGVGVPYG